MKKFFNTFNWMTVCLWGIAASVIINLLVCFTTYIMAYVKT